MTDQVKRGGLFRLAADWITNNQGKQISVEELVAFIDSMAPPNTFEVLERLIDEMDGPPGWTFAFAKNGDGVNCFMIFVKSRDNYDASKERTTRHEHPAPICTFIEKSWRRWLFDRCRASMDHEMGEMIRWGDVRPFAPTHGPGEDPYVVREYRDPLDALTTQTGSVRTSHGGQEKMPIGDLTDDQVHDLRQQMWKVGK